MRRDLHTAEPTVIAASPALIAVTKPVSLTVAMASESEIHITEVSSLWYPKAERFPHFQTHDTLTNINGWSQFLGIFHQIAAAESKHKYHERSKAQTQANFRFFTLRFSMRFFLKNSFRCLLCKQRKSMPLRNFCSIFVILYHCNNNYITQFQKGNTFRKNSRKKLQ